jgi:hypothetical protein
MAYISIKYKETELEIEYLYQEGEARTYDHPGEKPSVEIEKIEVEGVDLTKLLIDDIEELECIIYQILND